MLKKLMPKGRAAKILLLLLLFLAFMAIPLLIGSGNTLSKFAEMAGDKAQQTPQAPGTPAQKLKAFDPLITEGPFALTQTDADRGTWSWSSAKRNSAKIWEAQLGKEAYKSFYCGCDITRSGSTGGKVDLSSCGVTPRKSQTRASRLEWEHVVPASRIAKGRSCWTQGAAQCVDKAGKPFKGRACCEISDPLYNMAATDPVNLVPAVGEINGDRSNFPYADIPGEPREYGLCDMEIDRSARLAEPPAHRRGDIARVWAYMSRAYGLELSPEQAGLYESWIKADPVSVEEVRINQAIRKTGHRANPFVLSQ